MFGKKATDKFDPANFRVHDRRAVSGMKAYVDRELVEILDYSDGGMRVRSPRELRRVAVIEIFRGGEMIRNVVAVMAWQRGDQVGYAFRPKLKLTEVSAPTRARTEFVDENRNDTGGVSGSALRNRLNL